jgi:hypothetical protein
MKLLKIIGNVILEQEKSTWLYKWFEKVPDQKIVNTFSGVKIIPLNIEQLLKGNMSMIRIIRYSKNDILNIIKNVVITKVPKGIIDKINSIDGQQRIAMFINPVSEKTINDLNHLKKTLNDLDRNNYESMSFTEKEEIMGMKELIKSKAEILELFSKYSNQILIPDNIDSIIKNYTTDSVIAHETMHKLYNMTQDSAKSIIDKICDWRKCNNDYFNDETEIYSYLFNLRYKLNLQPTDIIEDVKIIEDDDLKANLLITVNRNDKKIILKDLIKKDSVYTALKCCKGNIEQSIKDLHNNLAMNSNKKEFDNMV